MMENTIQYIQLTDESISSFFCNRDGIVEILQQNRSSHAIDIISIRKEYISNLIEVLLDCAIADLMEEECPITPLVEDNELNHE